MARGGVFPVRGPHLTRYYTVNLTKMKFKASLVFVAGIFGLAGNGNATTIISDTFNAADGILMSGRAPDTTNLPGVNWYSPSNGWLASQIQDNALKIDSDNRVGISLMSAGSYTKPSTLFISADLKIGTLGDDANYPRGIWMGFGNAADKKDSTFNGLILGISGDLSLWLSGQVVSTVAYTGNWTPNDFHNLTFKVDSENNTLSDIALDGITANYTALNSGAFNVEPNYAYLRVSDSEGNHSGYIDNLVIADQPIASISAVPEPSGHLALLALGSTGLLTRRRLARRA